MSDYKTKLLGDLAEDRKRKEDGDRKAKGRPGPDPDPDSLTAQLERGELRQMKALIPKDLHIRTKNRANLEERTLSELVAQALKEYLEDR